MDIVKLKRLVNAICDDLERYLESPEEYDAEYFEDVYVAAQMAVDIVEKGE
jgi:uncharacterized circularly permuted ATP-grasp superfamily protein